MTGCQIHHFADASNYAFGVVSYVCFTNVNQDVHFALILSKSRVSPPKKATIPRLELTAAILTVRLFKVLFKKMFQLVSIHLRQTELLKSERALV